VQLLDYSTSSDVREPWRHVGAFVPVNPQLLLLLQITGTRVPTAAGWLRWRQHECRCGSCSCAGAA
jgi:hypothetical protein